MMMENTSNPPTGNTGLNTETLKENADRVKTQASTKTNEAMKTTSKTIDSMMMYFKGHEPQEMMDDLKQVVRKHPGKSIVSGLILGILVGKVMGK